MEFDRRSLMKITGNFLGNGMEKDVDSRLKIREGGKSP